MSNRKRRPKPNNRVKGHLPKVNGARTSMEKKPGTKKVPASEAEYLAVSLHEARANLIEARATSFTKDKALLGKDDEIMVLRQELLKSQKECHNLRIKVAAINEKVLQEKNAELRETHGLAEGRTIHKDDVTGEVFWLEPVEVADPSEEESSTTPENEPQE